jgi:hypothetical protein
MPRPPSRFAVVILSFAPLIFQRSWPQAELLLIGAIVALGKRTVSSLPRISGLAQERHFVKGSGLRWISLMLLAPIPWAGRAWALPFLSALAPSERSCRERDLRHKKLTDWARQLVLQARRWLPGRDLVLVGDSGFAALELLAALAQHRITGITRLRLDAALHDPAPPRLPGTNGRPRTKGARLPNLSDVLRSTDTRWQRLAVRGWYGEGDRLVELCSATAVWRHGGMPVVPIRWVLVRDPPHADPGFVIEDKPSSSRSTIAHAAAQPIQPGWSRARW